MSMLLIAGVGFGLFLLVAFIIALVRDWRDHRTKLEREKPCATTSRRTPTS